MWSPNSCQPPGLKKLFSLPHLPRGTQKSCSLRGKKACTIQSGRVKERFAIAPPTPTKLRVRSEEQRSQMDLPQFGRRHMCFYVHRREADCGLAYQTEGSHHWLKARKGSAWVWRRAESTMETLSWPSPTFHFTLTLSSLLFDLPPHGMGEGEGAAGAGNRSAESLDSADHQQLSVDVDRKEMRSRGGRQMQAAVAPLH